MRLRKWAVSAACVAALGTAAHADVFFDSGAFMAATAGDGFVNGFDDAAFGDTFERSYDMNGYAYTVTALNDTLFTNDGEISVNLADDAIVINFTSGNVTAVGGDFWATDINFIPLDAEVSFSLSDGTNVAVVANSAATFAGFTSDMVITQMIIDVGNDFAGANAWPSMDNLYVGRVIPAPGAVTILGLGGMLAARRRR